MLKKENDYSKKERDLAQRIAQQLLEKIEFEIVGIRVKLSAKNLGSTF